MKYPLVGSETPASLYNMRHPPRHLLRVEVEDQLECDALRYGYAG